MITIDRILCPTDFSDLSRRALAQAVALARWQGAEITLLYVAPPVVVAAEAYVLPAGLSVEARERLHADLRAFADSSRDDGVRIGIELQEGSAAPTILEAARGFDLIVMGTHGRHGLDGWLLGSVTEAVLRHSPCPVLTVAPRSGPASPALFERILCPIDFSATSERTAHEAGMLSLETGAHLVLLHVIDRAGGPPSPVPPGFDRKAYAAEAEENVLARLRRVRPAGSDDSVEERVTWGAPDQEILRVARDMPSGLIVMGAHGGAFDSPLFGSVAHKVVRRAPCPVLVLPAPARALPEEAPEPVVVWMGE